jgi:valine--pyruvate aminotransferase
MGTVQNKDIMKVSRFGQKIKRRSGISQLMVDMGEGLAAGKDVLMLGGGNPAHIPEVDEVFRQRMGELLAKKGVFERAVGNYDPPQGNKEFIEAISGLLRSECGWNIGPANVALTTGSQSAFFILFNIFAGRFEDGSTKKIMLPLAPEYIGYGDVGFADDLFVATRPDIEHIDEHIFKYHVDFDRLRADDDIGAICVSRPTNPTANVLTDAEIAKLNTIALAKDIPLIIDNAYGPPFPNIIFTEARSAWNENIVVCMSLSKFGLPATRTGIVVARQEIIEMVSEMNAVMSLGTGSIGAAIGTELVQSGELIRLSKEVIKPYYEKKAKTALEQLYELLDGVDFHIHKPEGAFFLWLWLPGLKITGVELYRRLKKRGVVIVPGHYFFPGLEEDWEHKQQCVRISYAREDSVVRTGLKIIAEEIKLAVQK